MRNTDQTAVQQYGHRVRAGGVRAGVRLSLERGKCKMAKASSSKPRLIGVNGRGKTPTYLTLTVIYYIIKEALLSKGMS